MTIEKILTPQTILKKLSVFIDSEEILEDMISSLEIKQSLSVFGIFGTVKFTDTFDIFNNGLLKLEGDNKIIISTTDFLGDKKTRTYRIISVSGTPYNDRLKIYEISFMDEITYLLNNTYLSKSFNCSPVDALQQYFKELEIDVMLDTDNLIFDFKDTSKVEMFVVPQNMSVLSFFIDKLKESNIRLWQDRKGIYCKEIIPSELIPATNSNDEKVLYSNKSSNNSYIYKIHDFQEIKNNALDINENQPKNRVFRYGTDKQIEDLTISLADTIPDLSMNNVDVANVQHTIGELYKTQEVFTTDNQKYEIFNAFMNFNRLIMAVPGETNVSNICQVANVELKGNIVSSDSVLAGDVNTSGKYFIHSVSDRIIGDKLIHRFILIRLDANTKG